MVGAGGEPVDPPLLVGRRIGDEDLEEEPVELGLGERVGPFLLDRVLRRQHEERVGQRVAVAADGHLPLLHRLQQRGLGLGGRPVDLVGQDQVREHRAPARTAARGRRWSGPRRGPRCR